jgi:hypothetical protein
MIPVTQLLFVVQVWNADKDQPDFDSKEARGIRLGSEPMVDNGQGNEAQVLAAMNRSIDDLKREFNARVVAAGGVRAFLKQYSG